MINKILIFSLATILFSSYTFGQALIIDHTTTDISQIPLNYIDSVKTNLKWHYAHTSHGQSLICGLELLEQNDPNLSFAYEDASLPDYDNTLNMYNGNYYYTYILPKGYWSEEGGRTWTFSTLNSNPGLNVSMFVWCGECVTNNSTETLNYLDSISSFEKVYPDVNFVYCTGNAQSTGAEGYNRYLNNSLIRQYCIENEKTLFDFADLDSWYNGEFNYYTYEGDIIPLEHPAYEGDSCGHVNGLSNMIKGKASWWMLARFAGWERDVAVNAKVYLEGSLNGSNMSTSLNSSGYLPLSQPFNIAPWNYSGTESVSSIPNTNIVDWVMVELRDVTPPSGIPNEETTVASRAGFLLNDGSIVDIDGYSPLTFNATINEDLYIVVRHQSHLDIVGAAPAILAAGIYDYDFTTSESQVYGGTSGHKEISAGIWGMISGDANGDGIINMDDKSINWLNQSGLSGYKSADFNMGGKVDNLDKNDHWLQNIFEESQVPN